MIWLLCVCAEFPPGAHRHPDDGVHRRDGERGEGDVLHQQVLHSRTIERRRTHPGAALRHRGCNHHLDQQGTRIHKHREMLSPRAKLSLKPFTKVAFYRFTLLTLFSGFSRHSSSWKVCQFLIPPQFVRNLICLQEEKMEKLAPCTCDNAREIPSLC